MHDPFVTYWEEQKCNIDSELSSVLDSNSDLIIVSAAHSQYKVKSTIDKIMSLNKLFIFDTIGLFSKEQLLTLSTKHKVSVLGRGD